MSTPSSGPRPVVAGADGSDSSVAAALYAAEEAHRRSLPLLLVHATPWNLSGTGTPPPPAEAQRLLAESVAGWRDKEPDVAIREVVVRDRPAVALREAAMSAELLVVGHRHRHVLARLGSTVHGLLHRTPCPLAVVPLLRADA